MITPKDLEDPTRTSGYRGVQKGGHDERRITRWVAVKRIAPGDGPGTRWYGEARATELQAAQDHCDFVNGKITPRAPSDPRGSREPDLTPRDRKSRSRRTRVKEGFPTRMRKAIHKRAGGRCENCYLPYPFPEAHHIDPDGGHAMENGASLCKNCHGVTSLDKQGEGARIDERLRKKRAREKGSTT